MDSTALMLCVTAESDWIGIDGLVQAAIRGRICKMDWNFRDRWIWCRVWYSTARSIIEKSPNRVLKIWSGCWRIGMESVRTTRKMNPQYALQGFSAFNSLTGGGKSLSVYFPFTSGIKPPLSTGIRTSSIQVMCLFSRYCFGASTVVNFVVHHWSILSPFTKKRIHTLSLALIHTLLMHTHGASSPCSHRPWSSIPVFSLSAFGPAFNKNQNQLLHLLRFPDSLHQDCMTDLPVFFPAGNSNICSRQSLLGYLDNISHNSCLWLTL